MSNGGAPLPAVAHANVPPVLHQGVQNEVGGVQARGQQGKLSNDEFPSWAVPEDATQQSDGIDADPDALELDTHDAELGGEPELDYATEYQKLKTLADSEDLPDEWLDSKFITVKYDGKSERISLRTAQQRSMLERDYSFKTGQAAGAVRQAQQLQQNMQNFLGDLDDPRMCIQAMTQMGKLGKMPEGDDINSGTGLLGAAAILADQMFNEMQMRRTNPEAYKRLMAEKQLGAQAWQKEMENRRLRAQLQQMQQQPQQQQATEVETRTHHQLQQIVPLAFKRTGLEQLMFVTDGRGNFTTDAKGDRVQNKFVAGVFEQKYAEMMPMLNGGPLTTEFMEIVSRATRQEVEAIVAATPQPGNGAPPSSAGIAARGQAQRQPGQQPQMKGPVRMRVSEMGSKLRGQ
jgi:hypothetical protein